MGKVSLSLSIIVLIFNLYSAIISSIFNYFFPQKKLTLKGEIVLVTGSGHGIGRELSIKFASLGATVICLDFNAATNMVTQRKTNDIGRKQCYAYTCDVADRDWVRRIATTIRRDVGEVTMVVNNAAVHHFGSLMEQSYAKVKRELEVNVVSHFWILEAFLPTMLQNNRGHVVAISSMCGLIGVSEMVPYCTSKYAVTGLMDSLAEELRFLKSKVKLTTVYPFYVDTGMARDPKYRLQWLFGAVTPQFAADKIVTAIMEGRRNVSIPRLLLPLHAAISLMPLKVQQTLVDFLAS